MNLIRDDWLHVEYLDGTLTKVSIRQAFIDAKKIKNIVSPTFHGVKVYIYDVPAIQLLVTIFEAAYFKPENNFMAKNKYFSSNIMENGWDENIILNYLDEWEYKFNLFDEKYPFFQDISLKTDKVDDTLGYLSRNSVIAPGFNNMIFEHTTESNNEDYLSQFKIKELDELVYILLYNLSMGTSPMPAQYANKSFNANMTLFLVAQGKNLFETIVSNSLPLRDSICDDELYDKPTWELNDYSEIKDFGAEIYKNRLLCTFLPIIPVYVVYDETDNEIKNIIIQGELVSFFKKEEVLELMTNYVRYNPWSIRVNDGKKDKSGNLKPDKYKQWTEYFKLMNLCIDATKKLPSGFTSNLLNPEFQENKDTNCTIYYRQFNNKKTVVLTLGAYSVEQDILKSIQKNENTIKNAEQYQKINEKLMKEFKFYKSGIPKHVIRNAKIEFSKFSSDYFFHNFVPNIDSDDVVELAKKELVGYIKNILKKISKTVRSPLKYAQAFNEYNKILNNLLYPSQKEGEENG